MRNVSPRKRRLVRVVSKTRHTSCVAIVALSFCFEVKGGRRRRLPLLCYLSLDSQLMVQSLYNVGLGIGTLF